MKEPEEFDLKKLFQGSREYEILSKLTCKTVEHLTCTICQDLMIIPFVTSCGHSFCYGCIYEWLRKRPRTCPICRTTVQAEPIPNHSLRNILSQFIETCLEIFPEVADTVKTIHAQQTELFEKDSKNKASLFGSIFQNKGYAVYDTDDGVTRCSECHWEVHGSLCLNCGRELINRQSAGDESLEDDSEGDAVSIVEEDSILDEDESESDFDDFVDHRDLHAILNEEAQDERGVDSESEGSSDEDFGHNYGSSRRAVVEISDEDEDTDTDSRDEDSDNEPVTQSVHCSSRAIPDDSSSELSSLEYMEREFDVWNGFSDSE
ncbi:E3 ubiquitin ligase [Komagataella phaffii CBS 7435]|uniref:RING-type domain-containing protein n=2 Tax=Komagataella phaffii TaxID=460519 RepID=C4R1M2_KOMPG|nr:uncharacterized protein PAS_chr2-1_0882 [Komagataella phaffii GS115]AOA62463.1 GQ67_00813T0 [Komagataella phaffii]CAH2448072.1 E3 ubiquitin ligase [Komagataella phaffii CBS 7435]AOA67174.1 GQ68_00576T0 [Komagataella phaffii GS115]CAY69396.1 hypothetical protein PAS_chr2-1_0882 [Komagataella phaffii GS115]CCA38217.1 E3 ubiquitin ligase [Komagataella phaffii CBS 7435]